MNRDLTAGSQKKLKSHELESTRDGGNVGLFNSVGFGSSMHAEIITRIFVRCYTNSHKTIKTRLSKATYLKNKPFFELILTTSG